MSGFFTGSGGQGQTTNSSTYSNSGPIGAYAGLRDALMPVIGDLALRPFSPSDPSKMFAPFNATQNQAFDQVQQAQNAWQPYYGQAAGALNQFMPAAQNAFGAAGAAPTPLNAAQRYTDQAAQTWPQASAGYLNPYIQNTVSAGNQLQTQNFLNSVLPGINSQFISSGGGAGGYNPAYNRANNFALNNFNQNIGNTTQGALANAYNSSNAMFNADANRFGALSGTVGNQAASGIGALTGLGTANAGAGNAFATGYGNLGGGYLNNTLLGSNALLQTGNQQQQQAQLPLTEAERNRQAGIMWPYQTEGWAAQTAGQWRPEMSNTSNTYGQTFGSASSGSSPAGTLLGGLSAVGSLFSPGAGGTSAAGNIGTGLSNAFFNLFGDGIFAKRGGYIPHKARGGYFGLDEASQPSWDYNPGYLPATRTVPNPGYLKMMQPEAFAAGGVVPVIKAGRAASRKDIEAARAKAQRPPSGLTRPLDLSSARPGYLAGAA